MADKQISQLVAASTINNDDLFVMQQGGTAKKLSGQKLSDFVYESAADQIERVNETVEQAQAAVELLEEQKNEIAQTIADMAQLGTDTTLTTPAMAADAKATGDRIRSVEADALAALEQAEIRGVAVASFNDGAEDAPVKSLSVAIDPAQDLHGYSSPWIGGNGKNILNPASLEIGHAISSEGVVTDNDMYRYTPDYLDITQDISYTLQATRAQTGTISLMVALYDENQDFIIREVQTYTSGSAGALLQVTFSSSTAKYMRIVVPVASYATKPQLEIGSSATTYEPYENICPISGWTKAELLQFKNNISIGLEVGMYDVTTGEKNPSTGTTTFNYRTPTHIPVKPGTVVRFSSATYRTWFVILKYGSTKNYLGSSTPTIYANPGYVDYTIPDDCFYITYYTASTTLSVASALQALYPRTAGSDESLSAIYEISFPNEAGTVYGGTLDVTNGVLTVDKISVALSSLSINSHYSGSVNKAISLNLAKNMSIRPSIDMLLDSYPYKGQRSGVGNFSDPDNMDIGMYLVYDSSYSDVNKIYLVIGLNDSPQGNMVYRYTGEKDTYQLVPTEVKTLLGLNQIWAGTGNINDLIYRKMPIPAEELENTIESMIAGVEHTMEATQNYTEGDLVIAVHKLYHIDSNIASGETLVPGTNCHITTIANELVNIMATVDGYFNALGNLAILNYQVVT